MSCTIGSSYTIKSGDTLFIIAEREWGDGDRWREIMNPNGTPFTEEEANNLQEGQEICLPKGKTNSPALKKLFPQGLNWQNCIKPEVSQDTLNKDVADYYDYWKSKYLKPSAKTPGAFYIHGENTGGDKKDKGTSEGQGYGMIITALMAGYDPQAKTVYDGLFKMFDTHRSSGNPNLMGWLIDANESGSGTYGSATDGDLDIAYSLLLAHEQWGSEGAINYLEEGKKIINKGLKVSNITTSKRTNVGDWAPDSDQHKQGTRSSDWMTAHFRAFHQATGDKLWSQVADQVYKMIETITKNNAPKTGLMPDFANGPTPVPAPEFLEGENDGNYYYNACRVPLRIVMDYGHYGTPAAKAAVTRMVNWIKSATDNNPGKVRPGYQLNGTPLPNTDYQSAVFIAPFVAASVSDDAHQSFLDKGWKLIKDMKEGYFEDTYNLMCMLFIAGNWWKPQVGEDK